MLDVRDLSVAYASRCAGLAPQWTELPVQYVDYTLWQRAQFGDLHDGDSPIAAQLDYWQDALAGLPERLQLPTDRPYPLVADQHGATVTIDWPAELQQQIAQVAREHHATGFMVVQAALAVLLSALSASSDVAVGFPIAGRTDPALDDLVGFFVNTLVLRVDLAEVDPTIKQGAVVLAESLDEVETSFQEAAAGRASTLPFADICIPSVFDPTLAPEGKHVLWVQVRVLPREPDAVSWDDVAEGYADHVMGILESYAPGLGARVLGRKVLSPADLVRHNANLVNGDSLGGSHHPAQFFFLRPVPGWGRHRSPVDSLFVCGASTWPGGGVGGASGAMVAKAVG